MGNNENRNFLSMQKSSMAGKGITRGGKGDSPWSAFQGIVFTRCCVSSRDSLSPRQTNDLRANLICSLDDARTSPFSLGKGELRFAQTRGKKRKSGKTPKCHFSRDFGAEMFDSGRSAPLLPKLRGWKTSLPRLKMVEATFGRR